MAQTLLTPQIITRRTLESLINNMVMPQLVYRGFENQFVDKIGTTLTIRKPNKFTVQNGPVINVQDINEPSTSIVIDKYKTVPFLFSDADMALTIDEFQERYIDPAMIPLANVVDYDLLGLANQFSNQVGTAGVTPGSFATSVQLVGQRMDENAAPQNGRNLVLNPSGYWGMAAAQSNAFVTKVSDKALINGYLNTIGNFDVYMDQNVQSQGAGTYGGTPLTNSTGTTQTGSSLITDGWTVSTTTLPVGTVFTLGETAGTPVYNVNPVSFASTGNLKTFTVVTATVTDGSGNSTITISPSIVDSGPYQNVSAAPADGTSITIKSGLTTTSHPNNLAFTKQAMGLVMVPLRVPQGMDMAHRETYKNISIRFVRGFDITTAQFISRLDILYGVAMFYDEMGCRLIG